ncbi:MAG: PEGA domain-containing protein [Vicinamibacterales bacterium]
MQATNDPLTTTDRRAHIVAAARALQTWIHSRDPEGLARSSALAALQPLQEALSRALAPPGVEPRAQAPGQSSPVPTPAAASVVADAPATPVERVRRLLVTTLAFVARPLRAVWALHWSRNAKLSAAAAILLVAIAWTVVENRSAIEGTGSRWLAAGSSVLTPPTTGAVTFTSVPDAAEVVIAGRSYGSTPVTTELAPGTHTVQFRRGEDQRDVVVDVSAGASVEKAVDWNAPRTGSLRIESQPPGATVTIQGREQGVTPVLLEGLPVGTHELLLRGDSGSITRRVTVVADTTTEVSESIYSGWVHVSAPFELSISRGNRQLQLDEQNQLMLPPGSHLLTFTNETLRFSEERRVEVTPGGTSQIAIVPSSTLLAVTASEPAEVFLDGERIGETAIGDHALPLGTHQVTVRSLATGAERQLTVTATTEPVSLNVDFSSAQAP